jgi:hypothetical protein
MFHPFEDRIARHHHGLPAAMLALFPLAQRQAWHLFPRAPRENKWSQREDWRKQA